MSASSRLRAGLCLLLGSSVLAGCSAGLQTTPGAQRYAAGRSTSWMMRGAAASKSLLYVSNGQNFDVYVYAFPSLKLAGKLTGFDQPQGECSDAHGNVWITSTQAEQIVEYAHGAATSSRTLDDPTGYPAGCAVDAKTGDLAVTNLFDFSGAGGVLVYKGGEGTPAAFGSPDQYYDYFAAYDGAGTLYVSGATISNAYVLSDLAPGKHALATISVDGATLHYPGSVQAIGSSLLLGDQECDGAQRSCFYEASVSGATAKVTRKIPLEGACDVAQAFVQGGALVGADFDDCSGSRSGAYLWKYPGGGKASRGVTDIAHPIGATISNV